MKMKSIKINRVLLALLLIVSVLTFSASALEPLEFLKVVVEGTPDEVRAAIAAGANASEVLEIFLGEITPLQMAVEENVSLETIKILLEAGADVNASVNFLLFEGRTALITAAASSDNPAVIIALIEAGADANMVVTNTMTGETAKALYFARQNPNLRNTEALRLLEELTEE